MFDVIYKWMENIAFYMVIVVAIMQMIPGNDYKKYIKFIVGIIMIIMLVEPIVNIFGINEHQDNEYKKQLNRIENASENMNRMFMEDRDLGE